MSIRSRLNKTCTIEVEVTESNARAVAVKSYVTVATGVSTRCMVLNSQAVLAWGSLGKKVTHRFYFDEERNLTIKHVIVFNGERYAVKAVNNAGGHLDRLWQLDAEYMQTVGE